MMKSGATGLAVLLMGLSCYAQPDNTYIPSQLIDCLDKAEDVKDLEDLDKECAQIIDNLNEDQERMHYEVIENMKKFALYNGCLPMRVVVERLSTDGKEIGLSKEAIQNAVESRLRAAHLYQTLDETFKLLKLPIADKFNTLLYVRVSVIGPAFSIELEYKKVFTDELSGVKGYASTWEKISIGIAQDAGFIMNALAGKMDEFLVEFLRVNEPDCETSRPATTQAGQ